MRAPLARARVALLVAAGVIPLSGCVTTTPAPTKTTQSDDCGQVQEAADCGGVTKLIEQAKDEGSLVIAGDPGSATALNTIAERFTRDYSITVTWADTGATTQERFRRAQASSAAVQPDVFTLDPGDEVADDAPVTPYRITSFEDRLPPNLRDPDGRWVRDFGGVMSIGYNEDALGKGFADTLLTERVPEGRILLADGSPESANAVHAVIMLDLLAGTSIDSVDGLELLEKQPVASDSFDLAALRNGEVTVMLDWSYQQAAVAAKLKTRVHWKYATPAQAEITGWHGVAINQRARHPAAARLWEEYLLGTGSQNYLLGMAAMPSTYSYLAKKGVISRTRREQMPVLSSAPQQPTAATIATVRALAKPEWQRLQAR